MIVLALEIVALTYRCPSYAAPAHLSRPEGYRRSQEKTSPPPVATKQTGRHQSEKLACFFLETGGSIAAASRGTTRLLTLLEEILFDEPLNVGRRVLCLAAFQNVADYLVGYLRMLHP